MTGQPKAPNECYCQYDVKLVELMGEYISSLLSRERVSVVPTIISDQRNLHVGIDIDLVCYLYNSQYKTAKLITYTRHYFDLCYDLYTCRYLVSKST